MGIKIMMLPQNMTVVFLKKLAGAEKTSLLLPRAQAVKIPEFFSCPPN